MNKKTILSGIQPSGHLCIGNYLGALKNWNELQDKYNSIFLVVDMHSITTHQVPAELRQRCLSFAAQYIACGINPDKSKKQKNINAGLFTYPILMASDILLYQADLVPVGSDQKQHLELARDLAHRFNTKYSETFKLPEPYIGENGSRIMSLQDPDKKMSKSDSNTNNIISLLDSPNIIRKKINRAVTDSGSNIKYDTKKPGLSNLINIYSSLSNHKITDIENEYNGKLYSEFKSNLSDLIIDELSPIQKKYNDLMNDQTYLNNILSDGSNKASYKAKKTISKVYRKVGFVKSL